MSLRSYILLTTALAGMSVTSAAMAQAASGATTVDEVVVTGLRESLKKSIQVKREANAVIDVITADGVGKFPDRNVAEALAHVPGVSVDHQFGEGERVAIHGTDPALNRVLVDGHSIASADWGGNPSDRSSRSFNYSLLAPEIVARAEVFKSPEARIDEGSLGGTVIVHTRKPLDLDANTFSGSLGYAYNDRSEKGNARASGLYSWKDSSGTFGVLLGATYDKQHLTRAGVEYFGYSGGDSFDSAFSYDGNGQPYNTDPVTGARTTPNNVTGGPTINGAAPTNASLATLRGSRLPCCINFAYFDQTRERVGVSAALQYKPTDDLEFLATGLHIDGKYDNYSQSEYSVAVWTPTTLQAATVNNGLMTKGVFGPKPNGDTAQLDTNFRKTTIKNDSLNLAMNWKPGVWDIHTDVGYTKATGGKDPEYLFSAMTSAGFTYEFDGKHTVVDYTSDPSVPGTFASRKNGTVNRNGQTFTGFQLGGVYKGVTSDEEAYGQIDFKRDVEWGPFTKILFGLKYADHTNQETSSGTSDYSDTPFSLADIETKSTPKDLFDGLGASGNATVFTTIPKAEVIRLILARKYSFFSTDYGASFKVDEKIANAYVQANFEQNGWRGNIGGRFVSTKDDSHYWLSTDGNNTFTPATTSTDYNKFLPSFNVAYAVTPDVVVRGALAKVIARPRYGELAGAFSRNDTSTPLTAGGGNPNLKPYEAVNVELSGEWYFRPGALVSAELFHRDISSYIVTTTSDMQLFNPNTQKTETYSVSSPINAQNAKVTGLLVSYQSDIAWGFGIQTNVSYAEAEVEDYNMPFLSKYTVNIIPYYEKGPFQARLSYNYRSSYFTGIGRRNSKDSTDGYNQLDLSASYQITDRMALTVNAQNLLDETYYSYSGDKAAPTAFYKNGRVLALSFAYKM
ncbi:TonB-dependent receptor [Caulobacter sp. BE254]|uniref:TonB-dependent receptor n=1 Tax=Caulobacter sp. BE254 TaxID=2817720 RepID=UPI00285DF01F|nr:TonB-dependent receptor [Caulobacter sp. BE254]MDR7115427.1 iron complex outermembrane receptor protein [Caulobacter sp. BE254]